MNTEQIIKALECCGADDGCVGEECPYYSNCQFCITRISKDALSLIKELHAHNENLKKENKYLRDRLAEEAEIKEDMGERLVAQINISEQDLKKIVEPHLERMELDKKAIVADTVKKMQELIKERCIKGGIYPAFVARTIDQIAKEMLEGENDTRETL